MVMIPNQTKTRDEVLATYARRLSSQGSSRKEYLRIAKEYIDYAEDRYGRPTVEAFLKNIKRKRNYSDNTLRFVFSIVRTLFKRNQVDWPFNRGEGPVVRESTINAPALDPRTVRRMIAVVKASEEPTACALLGLSTVYGLRLQEIINIKPEDIDLKNQTLVVATLKHGRERTHIIADQLVYHLERYDFSVRHSSTFMWHLWAQLEDMISLPYIKRLGWHSIRRTLDTVLLRTFPEATVKSFMRWKMSTSSDMVYRYSRTRFVGEGEEIVELQGDALSVDLLIFSQNPDGSWKHPFVDEWG